MSHIFISYSRKDLAFAQKIVDALAANDLDTWIDWKSIPKGEDWEQEIYHGIEEADAFLFLLSPDSVASEMCNKEIDHAVKNGKRILPIVLCDTVSNIIHPEISKRNWIFCRDGQDDFNQTIEETRTSIHTDYEWLKYHTRLQVKALEWDHSKDVSRLLRGEELQEAEQLLATVSSGKDPQPTPIQRLYVLASRIEEDEQLLRTSEELRIAYDTTLDGWASALDLRDKETEGHSRRVTEMTLQLAQTMGISESELVHIRRGAILHDIGKIGIPDSILHKPGPLTEEEWVIMRKHPQLAYNMLSPIEYLHPALAIPYNHHERWDGTGYPRGLKGEKIPLAARIFAVADVYVVLTSDRPYRPAWSEQNVLKYIRDQSGRHFDPKIVKAFFDLIRK
jgi:HD-GYP domain-containing protein (c-di-GMP phosphodiesterase class II)